MPTIIASGLVDIPTNNRPFGRATVTVKGMSGSDHVLLTSHVTRGGNGPETLGPLYCPFVEDIDTDRFTILVYDIQAGTFNVTVPVEWAVIRN